MKIGFDAKRAYLNRSGLGNYSRTLISQLCLRFPENEYFLFHPGGEAVALNFPPAKSITVNPSSFLNRKFSSYWRSVSQGSDIAKQGIDLFHGLSNELPLDIRKSGAVSVVTVHDLIFLRYPGLYKFTDRLIYKSKFYQSCKRADAVVAISEQTKTDIIEFLGIEPAKVHVVYQGCNPLFYNSADEKTCELIRKKYGLPENYILYVGTIEERKNLLQLVKAKHIYGIGNPLVVVGGHTPYMNRVQEYIGQNKMTDVMFLRNIQQEELPVFYQMADLFVYPSSFEGFGIPILEALNSGTPVVTGKGGCLEETGGENSLYVNPLDPEEIADAIKRILSDANLRERMTAAGKQHALNFREERTAGEMMKLYLSLKK
jgi:glycosyltransferase involved in cell wall biosynthesis